MRVYAHSHTRSPPVDVSMRRRRTTTAHAQRRRAERNIREVNGPAKGTSASGHDFHLRGSTNDDKGPRLVSSAYRRAIRARRNGAVSVPLLRCLSGPGHRVGDAPMRRLESQLCPEALLFLLFISTLISGSCGSVRACSLLLSTHWRFECLHGHHLECTQKKSRTRLLFWPVYRMLWHRRC